MFKFPIFRHGSKGDGKTTENTSISPDLSFESGFLCSPANDYKTPILPKSTSTAYVSLHSILPMIQTCIHRYIYTKGRDAWFLTIIPTSFGTDVRATTVRFLAYRRVKYHCFRFPANPTTCWSSFLLLLCKRLLRRSRAVYTWCTLRIDSRNARLKPTTNMRWPRSS